MYIMIGPIWVMPVLIQPMVLPAATVATLVFLPHGVVPALHRMSWEATDETGVLLLT